MEMVFGFWSDFVVAFVCGSVSALLTMFSVVGQTCLVHERCA